MHYQQRKYEDPIFHKQNYTQNQGSEQQKSQCQQNGDWNQQDDQSKHLQQLFDSNDYFHQHVAQFQKQIPSNIRLLNNSINPRDKESYQNQASDDIGDRSRKLTCINSLAQEIQQIHSEQQRQSQHLQFIFNNFQSFQNQRSNQNNNAQNQSQIKLIEQKEQLENIKIPIYIQQSKNVCSIVDHEQKQIEFVCTYPNCTLSRFVCSKCLKIGIHKHQQLEQQSHILDDKEFYEVFKDKINKWQGEQSIKNNQDAKFQFNQVKQILQETQFQLKQMGHLIELMEQDIASNYSEQTLYEYLLEVKNNGFNQLNDVKLTKLMNFDKQVDEMYNQLSAQSNHIIENIIKIQEGYCSWQIDNRKQKGKNVNDSYHNLKSQIQDRLLKILQKISQQNNEQQLQQSLDNIKQQLCQIQSFIKQYKDNQNFISTIDFNTRKYIIEEIDYTNEYYYASSISNNEQYLAYGGQAKLLKIYHIKLNKITKEIKLDNNLYVCQFTQDSSQLYIGLSGGFVQGYDVQEDFKEIYKQQIHSSHISNIITIQNEYLITCSADYSIIKTDIKSKQQIFKLTGPTNWMIAIDYNDKDEIIVSGSSNRSIKLWDCRNQSIIINKEQSHNNDIRQIQLINNNLNILSLDCNGNLYKWQIDLTNKDLIKIQQFSDQNKIFNFYQVNQDQNLLLICNNYAKILNQQGETINTIEHAGQKHQYPTDCRQLDNMNYIQIRAFQKIFLASIQE